MAVTEADVRKSSFPSRTNGAEQRSLDTPPPVLYDASASLLLTLEVQEVLDGLLPLLKRHARENRVPVKEIEVRGFASAEEDYQRLLVMVRVDLAAEAALEYWNTISEAVEEWAKSLPETQADIALDFIALTIWWQIDPSF